METSIGPLLDRLGLNSVAALHAYEGGECGRRLPDRENWKLNLGDGPRPLVAHLKKHSGPRAVSRPWRKSPAAFEADRCREVAAAGVPTMRVLAVGEDADGEGRSVFMTEDLTGYRPLDLYFCYGVEDGDFESLWERVATLAGRFHAAGFNHRDFYTCHWFVRREGDVDWSARLIDLQRVQRHPAPLRRRWVVKDLGQFLYSCPPDRVGPAEWETFLKFHGRVDLFEASRRRADGLTRKHGPYRDWANGRGEVWAD
ncbi:MAG: lipopolysaccharide kinase InaA family protein [Planctomycetota bacterium]